MRGAPVQPRARKGNRRRKPSRTGELGMAYQPGLFGYSFLFGCTLLAMSNMERFLKYSVDPMVERRTQAAKERHDGMMKAKELAAKASH